MPANTTSYSFLKPTVGGDTNAWGGYLNSNWDDIDDLLDGTAPVTGIDINGGSIDGTPIGASVASTGAFTTLSATTPLPITSGGTGAITPAAARTSLGAIGTGDNVSFGTGSFTGSLSIADTIVHTGDTDTLLRFTTNTVWLETGGGVRATFNDSGFALGGANARVTTIYDQDSMANNSSTALATQQSIKAYVDNNTISQGVAWYNVAAVSSTSYQNTFGKPIIVYLTGWLDASPKSFQISSNGSTWRTVGETGNSGDWAAHVTLHLPSGWYWRCNGSASAGTTTYVR